LNFSGNFGKPGPEETSALQETLKPQRFLAQFPIENIRDNSLENREFGPLNRENSDTRIPSSSAEALLDRMLNKIDDLRAERDRLGRCSLER
jgi:hypothetical protein